MNQQTSAIRFLASTISSEQQRRMDEAHETLAYAVRNKFRGLYASGLISKPESTQHGLKKTLPPETIKQIWEAANEGASIRSLSRGYDMTDTTLKRIITEAHGPFGLHGVKGENAAREAITLINEDGYRLYQAATKLGTSSPNLANQLKRIGYKYNAKAIKCQPTK